MSNSRCRAGDEVDAEAAQFDELPDGSGCFEIWEHLSEVRARSADD